jgi:hypothetical protein
VLTGAIVALRAGNPGASNKSNDTDLVAQKSGLRLVRSSASSAAMVPPLDFSKKQNNGHGASSSAAAMLPARCLGLGLVRGLDVVRRVVYVSSPLGPAQMAQVNLVQKGRLDTPPLAFGRDDFFDAMAAFAAPVAAASESGVASSSSHVLPYLSTSTLSASSGFGAKQMQSRHNLGRRRLA